MQPTILLPPPGLAPDQIKEKIVCIRAHRERIFNVSVERRAISTIFHNYGHGGAGWTFLFGCVQESLRQFEQYRAENVLLAQQPITVVGAGCYGLLTALLLAHKGYHVRIVAKEVADAPSYKAAGFFFPRARKCSTDHERAVFARLGMESYSAYLNIARGEHQYLNEGVRLLPAYYGLDIDPGFAPYIVSGLMEAPAQVQIDFGNGKQYCVMAYQTIFIDASVMMQQLHRAIAAAGVPIIKQELTSFDELNEPLIFNCAGLGVRVLTRDTRIVPVQGHLITLKNQSALLNYMINVRVVMHNEQGRPRDELIYFAPKGEGILGITFIRGQDSLIVGSHEFDRLLQRSRDFFGW